MKTASDATDVRARLAGYRASIDNIDAALIHMLAERFRCTKAVGVLKAAHGLLPLAEDAHFDPDFAEKFLNFVVREVIRHHEQIAASNGVAKIG